MAKIEINVKVADFGTVSPLIEELQKKHDHIVVNVVSGDTPVEEPKKKQEEPVKKGGAVQVVKDFITNAMNKVIGGSKRGSIRDLIRGKGWTSSREKKDNGKGPTPFDKEYND